MDNTLRSKLQSYGEVALNDELLRVTDSFHGQDPSFVEQRKPNFCNIHRLDCCGRWSRRLVEIIPEIEEVNIAKVTPTGLQDHNHYIAHEMVLVNQEWIVDGTYQQFSDFNRGRFRLPEIDRLHPRVLVSHISESADKLLSAAGIPKKYRILWEDVKKFSQRRIDQTLSADQVPLRPDYLRPGYEDKY